MKSSKKRKSIALKHPLLPCECEIKCIGNVKDKRTNIHAAFWKIENRDERMAWIEGRIHRKEVEVRRKLRKGAYTKDRNETRIYMI